jgi:hypothetical protein
VENKYWDDGYMRLLKIQGPNSKGQIPSPKAQVLIMRGDKARGDEATVLSKFQDNRLDWACKPQGASSNYEGRQGEGRRGDKDPRSKFEIPNSKVEVPSPNFMRGDKERGDGAIKIQDASSKFQIPRSKFQGRSSKS